MTSTDQDKPVARSERYAAFIIGCLFYIPPILPAAFSLDAYRSDFPLHNMFAEHMRHSGRIVMPHFLYDALVVGLSWMTTGSLASSGFIITVLFSGLLVAIVHQILCESALRTNPITRIGFSIAITLLSPISIFSIGYHHLYLGYIGLSTYFNPTTILLKPLALLHCWLLVGYLQSRRKISTPRGVSIASLTILCGLAKPHYLMCLIPALGIYWLLGLWKHQARMNRSIVLWTLYWIFIPAMIVIIWQFAFVFLIGSPDYARSSFLIAPFAGMREHSLNLAPKFLMSIILPAAILFRFRKRLLSEPILLFTGILGVIGLLYSYGLVEAGERGGSMNFIRAGEIAMFLLTTLSVIYYIRDNRNPLELPELPAGRTSTLQVVFLNLLLILSLLSGFGFYIAEIFSPGRWL